MSTYIANEKRYDEMEYRRLGKSGLKLPLVSLGFWHNFGKNQDFENMKNMCKTAFDLGVTHFDLADNYGYPFVGSAEENMGVILRETFGAYRNELIISTKAGHLMWQGPYGDWGSRKHLISSIDDSLKRLKLDYVDIFYHHRPDPETPLEETMCALDSIVKSGKALYVGLSKYDGETMKRASEILKSLNCPFVISQNRYSILNRDIEQNGVLSTALEEGKGVIAFSPLAQGLLSDKYLSSIPETSRVKTSGIYLKESSITPDLLSKVRALNALALKRGETLPQTALSWVLNNPAVTGVLIGASNPEQIKENVKVVSRKPFSKEELDIIDEISKG